MYNNIVYDILIKNVPNDLDNISYYHIFKMPLRAIFLTNCIEYQIYHWDVLAFPLFFLHIHYHHDYTLHQYRHNKQLSDAIAAKLFYLHQPQQMA